MECGQCREALSACVDGENTPAERRWVDTPPQTCGLVGLAQVAVGVDELRGAAGPAQMQVEGASAMHFAPTLATFVVVLTVLGLVDLASGQVGPGRFLLHLWAVAGLVLVITLDPPAGPPTKPRCPALSRPVRPAHNSLPVDIECGCAIGLPGHYPRPITYARRSGRTEVTIGHQGDESGSGPHPGSPWSPQPMGDGARQNRGMDR